MIDTCRTGDGRGDGVEREMECLDASVSYLSVVVVVVSCWVEWATRCSVERVERRRRSGGLGGGGDEEENDGLYLFAVGDKASMTHLDMCRSGKDSTVFLSLCRTFLVALNVEEASDNFPCTEGDEKRPKIRVFFG